MSRGIKFIHCADVHIGAIFSSLGDLAASRREDVKLAFEKVIGLADEERADLLLISGDLCEQEYARKSTLYYLNDQFSKIPSTEIFIIPGNHDLELFGRKQDFHWSDNVHILNSHEPSFFLERLNTQVYSSFGDYHTIDNERINILLYHGTVDMNFEDLYNPISSIELKSLGMDYIALGHFHNRIDAIHNPGSLEPLGFDEEGEHGVYVGTIRKNQPIDVKFQRIARCQYKNLEVSIASLENLSPLKDPSNTLVKVVLKGLQGYSIDQAEIRERLGKNLMFLKVSDETLEQYDFERIKTESGLKGEFVREMLRQIELVSYPKQKNILTNALYYGLEALTYGKINPISI